jgi:hypothetical protein
MHRLFPPHLLSKKRNCIRVKINMHIRDLGMQCIPNWVLRNNHMTAFPPCKAQYLRVQGGWETDETVEDAAARETLEEAGVRGIIEV